MSSATAASIEALPVAVYSTDAAGRIMSYNEAAAEFWGRRPVLGEEQWCGSWRLYWPDGSPMAHEKCPMARAIRENRPIRDARAIVERPDGSRALFIPYPTPIHNDNGKLVAAVNVLVEITADNGSGDVSSAADVEGVRQLGGEIGERLRLQKLEIMSQVTRGLAHDLNNVLQGLRSCFSVLREGAAGERTERIYAAAEQNIRRGSRLTQHLLTFGRHRTLSPERTDVDSLLDDMRPILESLIKGMTLEINLAEGTWPVLVDRSELEHVILNLSMNARDAMPSGGTLSFSAANASIAACDDGAHPPDLASGDYVTISVTDSGTGMDEETLSRACEPLFTTKDAGKGSGLGLSTVQAMAVRSGGGLKIASRPGRGTTVTIYLPRADVPSKAASARIDAVRQ